MSTDTGTSPLPESRRATEFTTSSPLDLAVITQSSVSTWGGKPPCGADASALDMGLQQALRHQITYERVYLVPNALLIDVELEHHLLLRLLKIMTGLD